MIESLKYSLWKIRKNKNCIFLHTGGKFKVGEQGWFIKRGSL